ncbi:MAG: universal stress protein [Amnibacterium sp.]
MTDVAERTVTAATLESGGRVVVGIDGSPDSTAALRAAAEAASLLHAELTVVTTWFQPINIGRTPMTLPDFESETEGVQGALLRETFAGQQPTGLQRVVRPGSHGAALVKESAEARLLVVGRRGHGGFSGLLLGSAAMSAVVHAHCSVLVLAHGARIAATEPVDGPGPRRVVVGVDGDAPSLRALAAAVQAAEALDARLDVVTAWSLWSGYADSVEELREAVEESARMRQDAAIQQVVPESARSRVRRVISEGGPAKVLLEEGAGADLLVVGVRSRSAVVEAFTGAVALTTAAHADCPVLVVRGKDDRARR